MVLFEKWSFPNILAAVVRLVPVVNALLIILLAHGLAKLSWNLLLPEAVSPPAMATKTSQIVDQDQSLEQRRQADFSTIADWHLFGETTAPAAPPPPPVKAPETRLNLRLVGVFFAKDDTRALALVSEAGGEARSYKIGDSLPGGARLERILRDYILLSRNGQQEKLTLPKKTADIDIPTVSNDSPSQPAIYNKTTVAGETIDASTIARRFRAEAVTRPAVLRDLAVASPHVENGQFLGFRLSPGRNRKLLGELGLRAGDIVTRVNGVPMESPAQGLTMLQQLLEAEQINLSVLRNGNEVPLTFYLGDQ